MSATFELQTAASALLTALQPTHCTRFCSFKPSSSFLGLIVFLYRLKRDETTASSWILWLILSIKAVNSEMLARLCPEVAKLYLWSSPMNTLNLYENREIKMSCGVSLGHSINLNNLFVYTVCSFRFIKWMRVVFILSHSFSWRKLAYCP